MRRRLNLRLRRSRSAERATFRYPLQPCPKVAVVCDTLNVPPGCRHISETERVDPNELKAQTIAAPASWLLSSELRGWHPMFPLIAFTGVQHGFIDTHHRDELWRRFGVPLFEELMDSEGLILASECEAHHGLHVDSCVEHTISDGELLLNGRASGIGARAIAGLCGCGQTSPRIVAASKALPESTVVVVGHVPLLA